MVTDSLLQMVGWFYDLCNQYPDVQTAISHLTDALQDFDQDKWNEMSEEEQKEWTMVYISSLVDDYERF